MLISSTFFVVFTGLAKNLRCGALKSIKSCTKLQVLVRTFCLIWYKVQTYTRTQTFCDS